MRVRLLAHPQLSKEFMDEHEWVGGTAGEIIALTAIRTCYSHLDPWEIYALEGEKYFQRKATEGEGREVDRLFRQITSSGHTSTLEHGSYTFTITGVTRSLLAQLTRHRVGMSFSVQSQRYVRFGSKDRSGGFDYVTPPKIKEKGEMAEAIYSDIMDNVQSWYDMLRSLGIPPEDARMVLPNAATVNLVMSANLTALIAFYGKRRAGNGAQWEIAELAEQIRAAVVKVEHWTDAYFERAWHGKKGD
jgi:thymidylate synthase (FAD)